MGGAPRRPRKNPKGRRPRPRGGGEVQLWAEALNQFLDQSPKLAALLSPAELAGAEKFRFVEDRERFVIRRGLLRLLLSRYLQQLPAAIEFQHAAYGKPEVRSAGAN